MGLASSRPLRYGFVHHVLDRRAGDPTLLVCLGAKLGRRAGIPLGVIGDGHGRHLLAHRTMNEPVALDPVADRPSSTSTTPAATRGAVRTRSSSSSSGASPVTRCWIPASATSPSARRGCA
jgi:hypothetical protein